MHVGRNRYFWQRIYCFDYADVIDFQGCVLQMNMVSARIVQVDADLSAANVRSHVNLTILSSADRRLVTLWMRHRPSPASSSPGYVRTTQASSQV